MERERPKIDTAKFNAEYLMKQVIPEVAQRHSKLKRVLDSPRLEGGLNDVEMAFYSCKVPEDLGAAVDHATLAVDIILRNHHVSLKTRRGIIEEVRDRAFSPGKIKQY